MKTYKREAAVVQLVCHWILVMFIVWIAYNQPDRPIEGLVSLATGLAVWVYGFAGTAFGLDAWAKQVKAAEGPQVVNQHVEIQPPEGFAE